MQMIAIQFCRNDATFGEVALSSHEVLPLHYALVGKLDRGVNVTGYRVWNDDLPLFESEARKRGFNVAILSWTCSCPKLGSAAKSSHFNAPEAKTCARCGADRP